MKVNLGANSYEIFIGQNIFSQVNNFTANKNLIITDENVFKNCANDFIKNLNCNFEIVTIPAGESSKNLREAEKLYTKAIEIGLDRKSLIIALGGGVVGDLSGFVAATFMRGINFIQVPTTLLAQVDSSVGGKTAVNHALGKNLIGAFYQPKAVFIDLNTLKTLPQREYISGLGEVVKYGVIADENFFTYLENNIDKILDRDISVMQKIIQRSCEIKADVVGKDEKESNLRRILNFGHTIAHVIEEETDYKKFLHGEAVAIGMLGAAFISNKLDKISNIEVDRLKNLLERLQLPAYCENLDIDKMYKAAFRDKKTVGGKINWVLMKNFGAVEILDNVPENIVKSALRELIR